MDSDNTTDDSGRNLMHQTNDEICIGENSKVTQHYPEFKNANYEEHLESPPHTILAVNAIQMLVFVRAKMYSEVIQCLGLALHLPH